MISTFVLRRRVFRRALLRLHFLIRGRASRKPDSKAIALKLILANSSSALASGMPYSTGDLDTLVIAQSTRGTWLGNAIFTFQAATWNRVRIVTVIWHQKRNALVHGRTCTDASRRSSSTCLIVILEQGQRRFPCITRPLDGTRQEGHESCRHADFRSRDTFQRLDTCSCCRPVFVSATGSRLTTIRSNPADMVCKVRNGESN
jgi:hypothetical protein